MAPDAFAQALVENGQVGMVVGEVIRAKALGLVLDHAEVVDTSGRPVDLDALDEPAAAGSVDDAIDVIPSSDE